VDNLKVNRKVRWGNARLAKKRFFESLAGFAVRQGRDHQTQVQDPFLAKNRQQQLFGD
jgi:hypothetical protein